MAQKLLQNTLRKMMTDPVEGFCVELMDDSNLFEWKIYLEGPKDTPYEGGIFQLQMSFPEDFPMSPPQLKFLSKFWHPNVYLDGRVCISILHPPGNDPLSGELPEERWLPTQTVPTIILSVMSMLNDPNTSSPANVDASVEWRNEPEKFKERCRKCVQEANTKRPAHVVIPHPDSDPKQREKQIQKIKQLETPFELYDDDYHDEDNDDHDDDDDDNDQDNSSSQEDSSVPSSIEEEKEEETKIKKDKQIQKENLSKKNDEKKEEGEEEIEKSSNLTQDTHINKTQINNSPSSDSSLPTTTTTTSTSTSPIVSQTSDQQISSSNVNNQNENDKDNKNNVDDLNRERRAQSVDSETGENAQENKSENEQESNSRKRSKTSLADRKKKKCIVM